MKKLDESISKELRKGRFRVFVKKSIDNLIKFIFAALVLGIILVIVSKFMPIYKPYVKCLWIIIILSFSSVGYSLIKYPKEKEAAKFVDALGLKERVITAIELKDSENSFAIMQKKDALDNLRKVDYRNISITPKKRELKLLTAVVLAMSLTFFLPNPTEKRAEEIHNVKQAKRQEIKKIDKLKKDIDKNEKLAQWEKQTLNNNLAKLQQDIKKSSSKEEIKKSIQKADKKLELVKQQKTNENLNKIAETFMKNKNTKELGEALKNLDKNNLKKSLEQTSKNLKNLSPEQLKKLSEMYKNLAKELKDNPEMAKAMAQLAESMSKGELGDISSQLGNMSKQLSKLMENQEFKSSIEALEKSITQSLGEEST